MTKILLVAWGKVQKTRGKLPEIVGRDIVTNTVLDSIPQRVGCPEVVG